MTFQYLPTHLGGFPDCTGHCIRHCIGGTSQVTPLTAHYNAALAASAEVKILGASKILCHVCRKLRLALTILEEFCRMYLGTGEHLQKPEKTVA